MFSPIDSALKLSPISGRDKYTASELRPGGGTCFLNTPHFHTHMATFHDYGNAERVQTFLQGVANLHGQTFLELQAVDCSKGAIAVSLGQKVVLSFNGYWGKRSE